LPYPEIPAVTLRDLVLAARAQLVSAGIQPGEAAMDAQLLAREALGWERARYLAHELDAATPSFVQAFAALVGRRSRREPVSEILGRREFWGLDFEVSSDVLTPRPETEILVEEALERSALVRPLRIADVGTGSGCLAVCLALEFPESRVLATDVSAAALAVARRNAARHRVLDRIEFSLASLLDGVPPGIDLIVSNPPYVQSGDIKALPPEVRDYEPHQALDGGPDGLDILRELMNASVRALAPGGWLIAEFGFGQETGVRVAVSEAGMELVAIRADLQGIPRAVVARAAPRAHHAHP
jgi:release factor glutamine methyltransferase